MINQAKNGHYKSFVLYIANDNSELKQVSDTFVKDLLHSFEFETNFFFRYIEAVMVCDQNLIMHTIAREPDRLTEKNIFRIILIDNYNVKVDKTFVCTKAVKIQAEDRSGDIYALKLMDLYSYYLSNPSFSVTSQSYSGTAFKIIQDILFDACKLPDEILRSYHIPVPEIKIHSNKLDFLNDPKEITFKTQQNQSTFECIDKLSKPNFIWVNQDIEGFNVIENPVMNNLKPRTASDSSPLWSETANDDYDFLIYDKLKQKKSKDLIDCPEITISLNSQGKSQETQKVNFKDIIGIFELNNNGSETADQFETRKITDSSGTYGVRGIVYEYFKRYLKVNNLVIFVSGKLSECLTGIITSVELRSKGLYYQEQLQGDYRYNGNWLIRSCTVKVVPNDAQNLFIRLGLCRFDNPKGYSENLSESTTEAKSDTSFPSSKPQKPFEKASKILSEVQEFTDKIKTVQSQIKGYQNYASQKIDSLTAPIKMQFVNQIKSSEVYQNVSNVLSKNRKTLGVVNNILKDQIGVNLETALSVTDDIMNIDSVIKESTIGQIEKISNALTDKAQQVVDGVTNTVESAIQGAIEVRSNIDQLCTNLEDSEVNLDTGLETIQTVLNTVNQTKQRIDSVKTNIDNLKTTVQNIPDTIKISNSLDDLKKKREQILSKLKM